MICCKLVNFSLIPNNSALDTEQLQSYLIILYYITYTSDEIPAFWGRYRIKSKET